MSECTTCTYYGRHLDGPAERMPWPCAECAGGEKYVERGKRKHQVPLRAQLAALLARHNALREAVAKMLTAYKNAEECSCPYCMNDFENARAEVDRLIANEGAADCEGEG